MMLCIPKVLKSDFPILKSVMSTDFPQTYEQWVDLLTSRCLERGTEEIIAIDINTEEFIAYMRDAGRTLNVQNAIRLRVD
jgi:hypothetical protein